MPKIKDGAYVKNIDEYKSVETHCIVLYVKEKLKRRETKKFTRNKNIKTNIYSIQAKDSRMCGYFCTGYIGFMLKRKTLLDYTNLISPNEYEKNDKIILKYFQ